MRRFHSFLLVDNIPLYIYPTFSFINFYILNYESMITYLQQTWKIQNKVTCSSTICVLSCFSPMQPFANPWTVAHQVLLFMGFSKQEYWSGLPWPPPGDLPNPGIETVSTMSPALTLYITIIF